MRFSSAIRGVLASAIVGIIVAACGSDGGDGVPACLPAAASTACSPLYDPTFDNVWKYTLNVTCAATGCHSGPMPKGNMALDNEQQAYANLLSSSADRVKPGDVKCGKAIVRLYTTDPSIHMPPPPTPLDSGALCSITQWIANGAKQP